jgi:hypothetical protein
LVTFTYFLAHIAGILVRNESAKLGNRTDRGTDRASHGSNRHQKNKNHYAFHISGLKWDKNEYSASLTTFVGILFPKSA